MPDFDKPKIAVYMPQYSYRKFCTVCDDKLKRRLSVTNIRYDNKKQNLIKKHLETTARYDWDCYAFMIEIPEQYFNNLWNVIQSDPELKRHTVNIPANFLHLEVARVAKWHAQNSLRIKAK